MRDKTVRARNVGPEVRAWSHFAERRYYYYYLLLLIVVVIQVVIVLLVLQ